MQSLCGRLGLAELSDLASIVNTVTAPTPAPLPSRPDIEQRLGELQQFGHDNIKDQHVVSQVLLKQFAQPTGSSGRQLVRFNIHHPSHPPKLKTPKSCGKYPNFIKYASRSVEQFWWAIENKMDQALNSVQDETILGHPEHLATIKDAVALHFVRGIDTLWLHDVTWRATREKSEEELLQRTDLLLELFKEKVGLYAGGVEALEVIIGHLHREAQELFDSGALLRARIEYLYTRARSLIDSAGLQFVRADQGSEFLIGDAPAISLKRDSPRMGLRGGVGLVDANTVMLPLGRRHVVALGSHDHLTWVDSEGVDAINKLQIFGAHQHVYFHPAAPWAISRAPRLADGPAGRVTTVVRTFRCYTAAT